MQEVNIIHENEKRHPKFNGFGKMLFWSYANLQMLCATIRMGQKKYDRSCYTVHANTFSSNRYSFPCH